MKICSKCGAQNSDNSKFCESCGNTFIDNSNSQNSNNTFANSEENQVPDYNTVL